MFLFLVSHLSLILFKTKILNNSLIFYEKRKIVNEESAYEFITILKT